MYARTYTHSVSLSCVHACISSKLALQLGLFTLLSLKEEEQSKSWASSQEILQIKPQLFTKTFGLQWPELKGHEVKKGYVSYWNNFIL